ncbi:hypothetical protein FACS1894113_1330 [Alphaproteobacteria bacterium]|nr:hypothetical protein FACS1894113_1330 [Alphaproteobacteria bacterium]
MGSIFLDIHTYIILSFVIMLVAVFKFGWKKVSDNLQNRIDSVKNLLSDLEIKKQNSLEEIQKLQQEIAKANEILSKSVQEANEEAEEISEKVASSVEELISKKQKEYTEVITKIKASMLIELQSKIVGLIEKELMKKMSELQNDREIQDINIDNSLRMFEKYIENNKNLI